MLAEIIETYADEEILVADGLDEAVIGICPLSFRLIYSLKKCIDIKMAEGADYEDACEDLQFNTIGAFVGEKTPVWCQDTF
jgi:hypothetical protein|tara:strand:+ start:1856 stop:2098 length:243 start_codon:yes stop_codon:yes gene_type:complete